MVLAPIALALLVQVEPPVEPIATAPTAAVPPAPPQPEPPSPPPAETIDEADPPPLPPPPPLHRRSAFGLELGIAYGGDRFLTVPDNTTGAWPGTTTYASKAGDGAFVSMAGSWTPYWSTNGVGLGLYARAGVKLSRAHDNMTTMSYARLPLAAGMQVLFPVVRRLFALARVGVMTEVLEQASVTIGGVERSSADFSPQLGEFFDAGVLWSPGDLAGLAAVARYERLDVSYGGALTSANNLGALAATYFRF